MAEQAACVIFRAILVRVLIQCVRRRVRNNPVEGTETPEAGEGAERAGGRLVRAGGKSQRAFPKPAVSRLRVFFVSPKVSLDG